MAAPYFFYGPSFDKMIPYTIFYSYIHIPNHNDIPFPLVTTAISSIHIVLPYIK